MLDRSITVDAEMVKKISPRKDNGLDNDWEGCEQSENRIRAKLSEDVEANTLNKIMMYPWFRSALFFHLESKSKVSIVALKNDAIDVKKAMLNEVNLNTIEKTNSAWLSIPHALLIDKGSSIAIRTVGSYTMDDLQNISNLSLGDMGWDLKRTGNKGNKYEFKEPTGPDTIVSLP